VYLTLLKASPAVRKAKSRLSPSVSWARAGFDDPDQAKYPYFVGFLP
jgi:hypothetical protein